MKKLVSFELFKPKFMRLEGQVKNQSNSPEQ